jgi:hypothetical protein
MNESYMSRILQHYDFVNFAPSHCAHTAKTTQKRYALILVLFTRTSET